VRHGFLSLFWAMFAISGRSNGTTASASHRALPCVGPPRPLDGLSICLGSFERVLEAAQLVPTDITIHVLTIMVKPILDPVYQTLPVRVHWFWGNAFPSGERRRTATISIPEQFATHDFDHCFLNAN